METELSDEIRKHNMFVRDRDRFQNVYETYRLVSKEKILNIFKMLKINKFENVKMTKKKVLPLLTVEELKTAFNDKSMIDLVVVKVDVDETIRNIQLKHGYSEKIAKGFLNLLLELKEYEVEELEILK